MSSELEKAVDPPHLIVLIHGGASSGRMYKDVIPLLTKHSFRCEAPDLPGHGSAVSQGLFTFDAAVDTITQTLQESLDLASAIPEKRAKVLLVGISLGGQVVLSFLQSNAAHLVEAAIISGVSIGPPDDRASWDMPHMPSDQAWLDLMMEDVIIAGMENMPDLQGKALGFTFKPAKSLQLPPTLVIIGEHDMAMPKRDYDALVTKVKNLNTNSEGLVMKGAWHNHSIDVPEQFADVILDWSEKHLGPSSTT